ncbi:hypothetical protein AXA88_21170 [Salmonella enterica]|nr:hypothetical protein [Salmonella enterica]EAX3608383.1 hypothetical protein [Salmonella enterica]EGW6282366.1 hypothetical protein [Salmonella enterica]EGX3934519.1 hypothetical protein [Salmonella enterica]
MNELAGLHPQISELSEYEQYLLSALLKKAAADAGRTLNITELRSVAAEFFASRLTDRKTHAGYHVTQNARQPRSGKERLSLETCTTTALTLTMNGR